VLVDDGRSDALADEVRRGQPLRLVVARQPLPVRPAGIVSMAVQVDEARGDELAGGVDALSAYRPRQVADGCNPIANDTDVGTEGWIARTVENPAAGDYRVERRRILRQRGWPDCAQRSGRQGGPQHHAPTDHLIPLLPAKPGGDQRKL